jgi:hypothetical protein
MLTFHYDPAALPKSSDIDYICLKELDGQVVLDYLKKTSQVLCIIPCEDGLFVVMRDTKGGAMPPYIVREKND